MLKNKNPEILKMEEELSSYPGGKNAVYCGIGIGFAMCVVAALNLVVGASLMLVAAILLFLYTKGVKIPDEMVTVLCSILASFPIFLLLSLAFWGVLSVISYIILLFL